MPQVTHHIPEEMVQAYVTGALPHAFSVVVAAHLSLCDTCRAAAEAFEAVGGIALETLPAPTGDGADMTELRARTLAALDTLPDAAPEPRPVAPYPAAVMAELGNRPPRWKSLGAGIRQTILSHGPEGSVRLLSIPGGKAVPDHGHNGLEMTLVLQGAFSDHTGRYGPGDVQVAETDIEHVPTAEPGPDCICLAATDAPLRFAALVPRMLQGVFRI
ncbi:ChrR family anti-sigma-E factor [Acidimangrovimonas sediminis]|uniref:ChrR family anti-sigma-E factor n=1 Tax=Acidimangrovimonas sediminis TaxID=2056283 RepID=UPI000C805DC3|nr:ChrR family anti-sigma-E factor [Acidimangrovimonas sediminis]